MSLAGPHLLPAEVYPFTVKAYGPQAAEPYWTLTVERPADGRLSAFDVPAARSYGVERCERVVIEWADGRVTDWST